jgi:hypothetical protein
MKKPPPERAANDRAPLCKICVPPRRHWGREPHVFKKPKR